MVKPPTEPAFRSNEQIADIKRNMEIAKALTRQDMFRLGFVKVEDLDDEELRVGHCRSEDGVIHQDKKKIDALPSDVYQAMVQEHARRTNEKLRRQLDIALDTMVEIMVDPTVEPRERFEASKYLFERVAGKTASQVNVEVTQKQPWEEVMGIAHLSREESRRKRGLAADGQQILDAEVEPEPTPQHAPEVRPYGYIQDPNNPGAAQQAAEAQEGAQVGNNHYEAPTEAPNLFAAGQPPTDPADINAGRGAFDVKLDPLDLADKPTCPPLDHTPPPVRQAPTWDNPVNSSSGAQPPHIAQTVPAHSEEEPAKAIPLSEQLRLQAEAAKALAEQRKEAKNLRQGAKKRRIIQRTMGFDATEKIDIRADIEGDPDEGARLKFAIGRDTE